MKDQWERLDLTPLKGQRVAIFGMANENYGPISKLTLPNWREYANRNNYFVRFFAGGYHEDPSRLETYGDKCRFQFYYDLRGKFDVVMSLDIDSLFVNMDCKIETEFQMAGRKTFEWFSSNDPDRHMNMLPQHSFVWTHGDGGPQSGLWIARTDDATEKHLRYAYEYASSENNVRHGKIEPNGISDQDAMTRLMNVPPFSATFGNCVPMESIGLHYPDTTEKNPWIVTCRGGSVQDKLLGLNEWSERICHKT